MSLDKIRNLQQGSEDFSYALTEQIRKLDAQITASQRARSVCQNMLDDHVSYATLDAQAYIDKFNASQASAPKITETYHEPAVRRPYHPVRRYVARTFDYALITTVLELLIYVVFRVRPMSDLFSNILSYGAPFLAVPLMALTLHTFGTTPGKWLMGLEVKQFCGEKIYYSDALEREWQALRYGYGFGVPFYRIYRLYKSYKQYGEQYVEWDNYSEYIYLPWDRKKKCVFSFAIIAVILLNLICVHDCLMPKYRGDLTISEFASNYNDYLEWLVQDPHYTDYLESNGTWKSSDPTNGVVVIIGTSSTTRQNFQFTTEGETITQISYNQVWTDVQTPVYPIGNQGELAFLTVVMSQPGMDYFDLKNLMDELADKRFDETATIRFGNVEISWTIDMENCLKTSNGFIGESKDEENRIELHYNIIIT